MENIRFVPAVFEPEFISRTTARRIAEALGKKPSEVCCPDQDQDGYEDTFDVANFTLFEAEDDSPVATHRNRPKSGQIPF